MKRKKNILSLMKLKAKDSLNILLEMTMKKGSLLRISLMRLWSLSLESQSKGYLDFCKKES